MTALMPQLVFCHPSLARIVRYFGYVYVQQPHLVSTVKLTSQQLVKYLPSAEFRHFSAAPMGGGCINKHKIPNLPGGTFS